MNRRPAPLALLLLSPATLAGAADLWNGTPAAIAEPVCVTQVADAMLADRPPPDDRFALIVRHLGDDALDAATPVDFGALDGTPLTNFHVPDERSAWQRARTTQDANYTSAFQLHCADAGFFVNTWRFEPQLLIDEGPHVVYGFAFSDPPPAFDRDPATDLAIQAELEVPWLYRPQGAAVALTYFQLRFVDVTTGRALQTTYLLHDTDGVDFEAYADYARNDSLFVSSPASTTGVVTRSPYSAAPSAATWTGLQFFRAQITQPNFRATIAMANAFCAKRGEVPDCVRQEGAAAALSTDPADYRVLEFGLITEIFNADTSVNGLSVGVHVRGLGLYNFR